MSTIAERLAAAGTGNAIELRGVRRLFGALAALTDITLTCAARRAARRARIERRRQDDAAQLRDRRLSADLGNGAFLRRGRHHCCRRTSAFAAACAAPTRFRCCSPASPCATTSISPAAASRAAASRSSARALAMRSCSRSPIAHSLVHLEAVTDRLVGELAHGQQRQLEIALALAGAPRFILFDEPAAGLSPNERGDLVAILTALPAISATSSSSTTWMSRCASSRA